MTIRCQDYIEERKDAMMGKAVFKGTRLTVNHILTEMVAEMSDNETDLDRFLERLRQLGQDGLVAET